MSVVNRARRIAAIIVKIELESRTTLEPRDMSRSDGNAVSKTCTLPQEITIVNNLKSSLSRTILNNRTGPDLTHSSKMAIHELSFSLALKENKLTLIREAEGETFDRTNSQESMK